MRLDAAIKSLTDSVKNKDWAYGPAVQSVLDALAAERQLADELQESLNQAAANTDRMCAKASLLDEELAELRGTQEPVAFLIHEKAKPVVLPNIDDISIPTELALSGNDTELFLLQYQYYVKLALKDAGIVVKDGE